MPKLSKTRKKEPNDIRLVPPLHITEAFIFQKAVDHDLYMKSYPMLRKACRMSPMAQFLSAVQEGKTTKVEIK